VSESTELSPELQRTLLTLARETIETYVRTRKMPEVEMDAPELQQKAGAFVTIKTHGRLRGCIGHIRGIKPLYRTVIEMAVAASTQDPRFPAMREDELQDMHLEISVMTPLQRVENPEKIQVGTHGILMQHGFRSGLLLPQVATEHHWDRETFLEHTCLKAGLSPNDWKDPNTEIYIFSAQVFHETEPDAMS
jgi:AmmeMemoRadiSam system protein A